MKMNLEKGDPCFVRLHTGEVVEATYHSHWTGKMHNVSYSEQYFIAVGRYTIGSWECNFQYPLAEMKRQMGLQ